jgi:hypothetical protein
VAHVTGEWFKMRAGSTCSACPIAARRSPRRPAERPGAGRPR